MLGCFLLLPVDPRSISTQLNTPARPRCRPRTMSIIRLAMMAAITDTNTSTTTTTITTTTRAPKQRPGVVGGCSVEEKKEEEAWPSSSISPPA